MWPVAQAVNFGMVPAHYRVLFIGSVSLGYNAAMSYIKHEDSNYAPYDWQDAYAHLLNEEPGKHPIDDDVFPHSIFS